MKQYRNNREMFELWAAGKTGVPFIDANMREINQTGWMSNRGRQNVASFLMRDLKVNWQMGAEYFESLLLDYDPAATGETGIMWPVLAATRAKTDTSISSHRQEITIRMAIT
jgi:deoxyribodipyrimidine photolyase